ncbi:ATPase [Aureococcus anophagefferens]|nr:ATPase [Aureococcus anophagefferens]
MEADYARLETDASAPPVEIVWDGVGVAAGAKEILVDAHGRAVSGRVLALMGPSGAGKTTLLNALSERRGGPCSRRGSTCASRRGCGTGARPSPSARRADAPWPKFGLAVADGAAGAPATERLSAVRGRGLSGGERKRLGIALEALRRAFYLDEPTTGWTAASRGVVASLRRLAARETLVVLSVHQPGARAFALFDDLVVFLAAANMAIVYVMVDPRCGKGSGDDRAHFLAFLLVAQLVADAGAGLGYCLPAVLPVEVALIVAPVVVYPCILFGGLYERSVDIPWYFAWWNSVNPLYRAVLEFYGLGNLSFSASCWSLLAVGTGLRLRLRTSSSTRLGAR